MSKIARAKELADSYLDEIAATLEIRHAYSNIVVSQASALYGAFKFDENAKKALTDALRHKTVDPSAFYKPLVVQTNGVFENYIRMLVRAVIEERFESVNPYSSLDKKFRNDHISHTAKVLGFIKSGSVMGSAYNFDLLVHNFGKSLSDQQGFKLHPEVYTKLLGNPTATRLTDLFAALSLPAPFGDDLGKNAALKAHFADRAKGRVSSRAEEELDKQLSLRNDIVHGELTRAINLAELEEIISFFRAFISALDELVR